MHVFVATQWRIWYDLAYKLRLRVYFIDNWFKTLSSACLNWESAQLIETSYADGSSWWMCFVVDVTFSGYSFEIPQ